MPRPKRQIETRIEIDGFRLVWRLHREQRHQKLSSWGVSVHVQREDGAHRDLFLEYPMIQTQKLGLAQADYLKVQIQSKKVEAHIRQAIAAGWDPESRGQPFVYEVSELPN